MNLYPKSLRPLKLVLMILVSFFLTSSCKNEVSKEANVCTLTPEQAPAIKGLRLGMSYEEVIQKFRVKCNLRDNTVDNAFSGNDYSQSYIKKTMTLRKYYMHVSNNDSGLLTMDKPGLQGSDAGCGGNGNFIIYFNPSRFPEFEDTKHSTLYFDENKRLSSINVLYYDKYSNLEKVKDSLGLTKWTNWDISESRPSIGDLYCSNLLIHASADYLGFGEEVDLTIKALTNEEVLTVKNKNYKGEGPKQNTPRDSTVTTDSRESEITRGRYAECVRQREAFGVGTSPCSEWASER